MSDITKKEERRQDIDSADLSQFNKKKKKNFDFAPFMLGKVSELTLEAIDNCGSNLLFLADEKKEKHKLKSGFFCKNRWCPFCAWRKARKDAMKLGVIMNMMVKKYKYDFLFITATTPNVKADGLKDEIDHFNKSFMKMMKRKKIRGWGKDYRGNPFKGVVKGYAKKIEVTYNSERDDFNPHIHAIFAVKREYFSRKYINQEEWLDLWRDVTGMPEITQFHVQKVKMDNESTAVQEVAKYSAKDSDYLVNQEVFDTFFTAMKYKRLLVYGGCMYDFAKDYDNGDLDDWKMKDENVYVYMLMAKFNYDTLEFEKKYRELTDEEKAEAVGLTL